MYCTFVYNLTYIVDMAIFLSVNYTSYCKAIIVLCF